MKPAIDPSALRNRLRQRLGHVDDLVQLAEGEESRAFSFRYGEESLVVRINRSAAGFHKDAFAHHHFAGPSLPIPEVLFIEPYNEANTYCVSKKAPGLTLQALPATALMPVLAATEAVLFAIAATDVSGLTGFGPFDADGIGSCASWREFLLVPCQYAWDKGDLPAIRPLIATLSQLATQCPERRCLVHGDFGSNNVLTDGRDITGVIDWSEALLGDPLYDVANVLFWRTWLDCMAMQAAHFERFPNPSHRARLQCYQLRIGLQEIHTSARSGDTRMAAWALARCQEIARGCDAG